MPDEFQKAINGTLTSCKNTVPFLYDILIATKGEKSGAVVWAVEHFKYYLYGEAFTVVINHLALLSALNASKNQGRYNHGLPDGSINFYTAISMPNFRRDRRWAPNCLLIKKPSQSGATSVLL